MIVDALARAHACGGCTRSLRDRDRGRFTGGSSSSTGRHGRRRSRTGPRRGMVRTKTADVLVPSSRAAARSIDVHPWATRPRSPRSSRTRRAALYALTLSGRDGSRLLPISAHARARGRHVVMTRQSACRARTRASSRTARRRSARNSAMTGSARTAWSQLRWSRARRDPAGIAWAIARLPGECLCGQSLGPADTPYTLVPGNTRPADGLPDTVGLGLMFGITFACRLPT